MTSTASCCAHVSTRRWFGLYFAVPKRYFGKRGRGANFASTSSAPPPLAAALRETYAAVLPAWHMNKVHWITVRLHGDIPRANEIEKLLRLSYDITDRIPCAPARRRASRAKKK